MTPPNNSAPDGDSKLEKRLREAEAGASKWQKVSMGLASAMMVMAGVILRKF